jgi:hypothetical protein
MKGEITMSTIRRHGVAFHLLPTSSEAFWLEVIRESDGAVLIAEEYTGDGIEDFAGAVDEWFDDIIHGTLDRIEIPLCRVCGARRRTIRRDAEGWVLAELHAEFEFQLCFPCASNLQRNNPWLRAHLDERHGPGSDDNW